MDITLLTDILGKDRIRINLIQSLRLNCAKFIRISMQNRELQHPKLQRQKATFLTFYEPDTGIYNKLNKYVLCKEYIKTWIKNIEKKNIDEIKSDIIFLKYFLFQNISHWISCYGLHFETDCMEKEAQVLYIIRCLSRDNESEKLDKAIHSLIIEDNFMVTYYKNNSFDLDFYKTKNNQNTLDKFLQDIDTVIEAASS
jgi:hypothetical protein